MFLPGEEETDHASRIQGRSAIREDIRDPGNGREEGMKHHVGALTPLDGVHTSPNKRHNHPIHDRPVGAPDAKRRSCNGRIRDMVCSTSSSVEYKDSCNHDYSRWSAIAHSMEHDYLTLSTQLTCECFPDAQPSCQCR